MECWECICSALAVYLAVPVLYWEGTCGVLGAHLQCTGSVLGCTCSVVVECWERTCSVLAVYLAAPVVYCECTCGVLGCTCSVLALYLAVAVV